jgi:hypothetical protein
MIYRLPIFVDVHRAFMYFTELVITPKLITRHLQHPKLSFHESFLIIGRHVDDGAAMRRSRISSPSQLAKSISNTSATITKDGSPQNAYNDFSPPRQSAATKAGDPTTESSQSTAQLITETILLRLVSQSQLAGTVSLFRLQLECAATVPQGIKLHSSGTYYQMRRGECIDDRHDAGRKSHAQGLV